MRGRPKNDIPSFLLHKSTGQAYTVTEQGRPPRYWGKWSDPRSRTEYDAWVVRWLANGRRDPDPAGRIKTPTVRRLTEEITSRWIIPHYQKDGHPTSEVAVFRAALTLLCEKHGDLPAWRFGPLELREVVEHMLAVRLPSGEPLARRTVNQYLSRIRFCFRKAVSFGLVPGTVAAALADVEGQEHGRTTAREPEPIEPPTDEQIRAVVEGRYRRVRVGRGARTERRLVRVPDVVADLIALQVLTGARPGEIVRLRGCDLIETCGTWLYFPHTHKMIHRGRLRVLIFGADAREVLSPYLGEPPTDYLFHPPGPQRGRAGGHRYTVDYYRLTIHRACVALGVEPWSPNQLRHEAAVEIDAAHGEEVARTILGHSDPATTRIYTHLSPERRIAEGRLPAELRAAIEAVEGR